MSNVASANKSEDKSDPSAVAAGTGKLPGTSGFEVSAATSKNGDVAGNAQKPAASMTSEERERNAVFGSLVKGDDDIVGLVAYSIYKQNKHDWLVSFEKSKSCEPGEAEAYSYIVGESTARRLAIYRHLAQATLEGRGPQVSGGPAKEKFAQHSLLNANKASNGEGGAAGVKAMTWIIGAIAIVVALYVGAKYGMPGLPK